MIYCYLNGYMKCKNVSRETFSPSRYSSNDAKTAGFTKVWYNDNGKIISSNFAEKNKLGVHPNDKYYCRIDCFW